MNKHWERKIGEGFMERIILKDEKEKQSQKVYKWRLKKK